MAGSFVEQCWTKDHAQCSALFKIGQRREGSLHQSSGEHKTLSVLAKSFWGYSLDTSIAGGGTPSGTANQVVDWQSRYL